MAILPILHYFDPRLRETASPVTQFDQALNQTIEDMFESMEFAKGIGLAAPQIGLSKSIFVMDLGDPEASHNQARWVFINPKIEILDKTPFEFKEGCLSVPGILEKVKRPTRIQVNAQDATGASFSVEAEGLFAVCIQHENDHLLGKIFIDYLPQFKREKAIKQLQEQLKTPSL